MSTVGNPANIFWHENPVGKAEREKLLNQHGCVVWITGLSGSGKSTLACSLGRELQSRGKLSYVLDGDNLRHGLNKNLWFSPESRTENIRRKKYNNHEFNKLSISEILRCLKTTEVAKLFANAGLICIASLISPYRKDGDAYRALLPDKKVYWASLMFIDLLSKSFALSNVHFLATFKVFMNMPLQLCEGRNPRGLYKLARVGKIKGFTGIDDPYEPPLSCEIEIQLKDGVVPTPNEMAGQVVSYMEDRGFLEA